MIKKENLFYPSGQPMVRWPQGLHKYYDGQDNVYHNGFDGRTFTRADRVVNRKGLTIMSQKPVPTAVKGILEGPYHEFHDNEKTIDGWCRVDLHSFQEQVFADTECKKLLKHTVLDPVTHGSLIETRYNIENGGIKHVKHHEDNIPHGDSIYYTNDGTMHMAHFERHYKGMLEKSVYMKDGYVPETEILYTDPSKGSFVKVSHRSKGTVISEYRNHVLCAKEQKNIAGELTQSHEYDANGQLDKGSIIRYPQMKNMPYVIINYEVDTHDENGLALSGKYSEFDQNSTMLSEGTIQVKHDYPIIERTTKRDLAFVQ